MPSAYVIVNSTVTDLVQYEGCKRLSSAVMQTHGASIMRTVIAEGF